MSHRTIELTAKELTWASGRPRRGWWSTIVVLGVLGVAMLWVGGCQRTHWLVWFGGGELSHAQAKSALETPHSGTDRIVTAIATLDLEHQGSIDALSAAATRLDAPGIVSRDTLRHQAERCITLLCELGQRQDEVGKSARAHLTSLQKLIRKCSKE